MDYSRQGSLIKFLREEKGISQEKLADGIMARTNLSRLENGVQDISKV